MKKLIAEFIGTMWLVIGGCGAAYFACNFPDAGIGFLGVSLAFGLTVVSMAYAIGHISGCHLNPAVSIGLWAGGRFEGKDLPGYIGAQLCGGIVGAGILYLIASGQEGFETVGGFASNGYTEGAANGSPGGFGMISALVIEIVMTFFFLIIILGSTHSKAPKYLAGLAIGLGLTLIHLISIPVTNTSVNPARSTSQAIFADNDIAMGQLWLFWVAPIVGAILAGLVYKFMSPETK